MSSSVFIERNPITPNISILDNDLLSSNAKKDNEQDNDADLVVVYGKNKEHVDYDSIKKAIEVKALGSLSVLRLLSPTPSMEAEEERTRREKHGDEDQKNGSDGGEDGEDDDMENDDAIDSMKIEHHSADNSAEENKPSEPARRGRKRREKKIHRLFHNPKRGDQKEKPEIVGLSIEHFYTADSANNLLKEVLKKSGMPVIDQSEHDFQLYVIMNDHCYTTFSTKQLKKLSHANAPDGALNDNRNIPQTTSLDKLGNRRNPLTHSRQIQNREGNRQDQVEVAKEQIKRKNAPKSLTEDCTGTNSEMKQRKEDINLSQDENDDDDDERFLENESTEGTLESDNDRDSDVDFNVNNRNGRKRRLLKTKKIIPVTRVRPQQQQQQHNINISKIDNQFDSSGSNVTSIPSDKQFRIIKSTDPIIKASNITVRKTNTDIKPIIITTKPITITTRRGPIVQIAGNHPTTSKSVLQTPQPQQHNVKEIVINKVMPNPKGVFTDINTLFPNDGSASSKSQTVTTTSLSPSVVPTARIHKIKGNLKGFVPLVTETALQNQLPAQISIETHQSSSELDGVNHESNTHDLINQNRTEEQIADKIMELPNDNDNIPNFMKMLENADILNTTTDVINLPNQGLLTNPDEEIPAELLKQVVELIGEDKRLQEEVEKQVLNTTNMDLLPLTHLEPMNTTTTFNTSYQDSSMTKNIELNPINSSKSIIELQISNVHDTLPSSSSSSSMQNIESGHHNVSDLNTSDGNPDGKEPRQIVRGNGRIITLPAIEAPTTRAKHRAQVQTHVQPLNTRSLMGRSSKANVSNTKRAEMMNEIVDEQQSNILSPSVTEEHNLSAEDSIQSTSASIKRANTSQTSNTAKKSKKAASAKSNTSKSDSQTDSVSHDDDDDPNKLWCLCRQPHNNRFMICCDSCEDWFHGTCVGVTKAMGLEMEQKGIDWTCPKCVKKHEEKTQPKISDMFGTKTTKRSTQMHQEDTIDVKEKLSKSITVGHPIQKFQTIGKAAEATNKSSTTTTQPSSSLASQHIISTGNSSSPVSSSSSSSSAATPITKRVVALHNINQNRNQHIPAKNVQTPSPTDAIESHLKCIVCKKSSRTNSVYCSDECIRKHVQNALQAYSIKPSDTAASANQSHLNNPGDEAKKKKSKGLFEDLLSMADRKPKIERVTVFERKTGRVLCGNNAPTTTNLKKWILENPTFEVVQPGSPQAIEIEKKQKQRFITSTPIATTTKLIASVSPILNTPKVDSHSRSSSSSSSIKSLNKYTTEQQPKQLKKYPQQVAIKPDKIIKTEIDTSTANKTKIKKQDSSEPTTADSEPLIRLNVCRTMQEHLMQRIKEMNSDEATGTEDSPAAVKSNELTPQEVEEFVKETENEMFEYFNNDTGLKYKAKYRSLIFNIKDRKNRTLFEKICAKMITPKQLVRMSPEEMASQELAQWRENENKHQLEIIKKSELDLLSCSKNFVLKTHKGEEMIVEKPNQFSALALPTSGEEDIDTVLNKSGVLDKDFSEQNIKSFANSPTQYLNTSAENSPILKVKKLTSSDMQNKSTKREEKSHSKESDKDRERSSRGHEHDKKYKTKNNESLRERSKGKRHSRSRTRSRSRERKHKSSSHRDERKERDHRDKDKERIKERDREREKDRERERDRHKERGGGGGGGGNKRDEKNEKKTNDKKSLTNSKTATTPQFYDDTKEKGKPTWDSFNLVDKILESTKTIEEAANIVIEKQKDKEKKEKSVYQQQQQQQQQSQKSPNSETNNSSSSNKNLELHDYDQDSMSSSSTSTQITTKNPYIRYFSTESLWRGNLNMIDVATFHIIIKPFMGNCVNIGKLFPDELDVVGRIEPDTVWDYILKIKKSPNKEIVLIRLFPSSDNETVPYTILFHYLNKRKRLGVIKTKSVQIKDFYIFPLAANQQLPNILQPLEYVECYEDKTRPNMLIGVVIRVIGKRSHHLPSSSATNTSTTSFTRMEGSLDTFNTPPGSPKRKRHPHNLSHARTDDEMDIDAIIKAPIIGKSLQLHQQTATFSPPSSDIRDDADEPYSPGDSSDSDNNILQTTGSSSKPTTVQTIISRASTSSALKSTNQSNDELKRKMEEINRQIAAQEMEIAGLLNVEKHYTGSSSTVLANISIPSNLSQILASIKSKSGTPAAQVNNPMLSENNESSAQSIEPMDIDDEYNPLQTGYQGREGIVEKPNSSSTSTSRLAQLTEAELLRMVPDDMIDETLGSHMKSNSEEPPPPGI